MSSNEIKLSDEQIKAIERLKEFVLEDTERCISLVGSAGTGKTRCIKYFIDFLDEKHIKYILAAPTHKAKLVLENMSGREAETIHRLLALSPDIDIFELDFKELQFKSRGEPRFPAHGVVIIDEASMISDDLFDALITRAKEYGTKIVFQGDIKQLNPVKQNGHSKVFSLENMITLTKIFRQSDKNGVMPYLNILREKPLRIDEFKTNIGSEGSLIVSETPKEFLKDMLENVQTCIDTEDTMFAKVTAWTNKRVDAWNNKIRACLFKDAADRLVNKREIITACDNFTYNNYDFFNSSDYIVDDVQYKCTKFLPNFGEVNGIILDLYDTVYNDTADVFVITENKRVRSLLAETIEDLRIRAIKASKVTKKYWKDYFALINSFASFVDLKHENRTIKKNTFTYGYAVTTHKLQGSSITNMFVDLMDICKNEDPEELRQLEYVALSRTRNNVYLLT